MPRVEPVDPGPLNSPPYWSRYLFFALGRRVAEQYRPWAAFQIQRAGYQRRRAFGLTSYFVVVAALPRVTTLKDDGFSTLLVAVPVTLMLAVGLARPNASPQAVAVLLARHGTTPDGAIREAPAFEAPFTPSREQRQLCSWSGSSC